MKKTLFTLMLLCMTALTITAQGIIVHQTDSEKISFKTTDVTRIEFSEDQVETTSSKYATKDEVKAGLDGKADKAELSTALDAKADKTALDSKADKTELDAKADKIELDAKADKTEMSSALDAKADATALETKADKSDMSAALEKIKALEDLVDALRQQISTGGGTSTEQVGFPNYFSVNRNNDVKGYTRATISGSISGMESAGASPVFGVYYTDKGTPSRTNGTLIRYDSQSSGQYSFTFNSLKPSTTYYYRLCLYADGVYYYGDVCQLTTLDLANISTGNATPNWSTATLNATHSYGSFASTTGIMWSTDASTSKTQWSKKTATAESDGSFVVSATNLKVGTMYYYCGYTIVEGNTYYGEVNTFTTKDENLVSTGDVDAKNCDATILGRHDYGTDLSSIELLYTLDPSSEKPNWSRKSASSTNSGDCSFSLTGLGLGVTYSYCLHAVVGGKDYYGDVRTFIMHITEGQIIDLGLPSGLKWASYNVGANSPEEYGGYYAWGETEEKTTYNWSTYFDSVNGSSSNFNKYATNKKTVLDPEDDVAHVKWGGTWRMPTSADIDELVSNCTTKWTTYKGVNGRLVVGPNGNSLFVPAAGHRDDTSLYYAGSGGSYWSASLVSSYSIIACGLGFYSGDFYGSYGHRFFGQSVRPVCP